MKKKKNLLYVKNAKKIYETEEAEQYIQEFLDEAVTYDGIAQSSSDRKGEINNEISSYLFEYLEGYHVPTHFSKKFFC